MHCALEAQNLSVLELKLGRNNLGEEQQGELPASSVWVGKLQIANIRWISAKCLNEFHGRQKLAEAQSSQFKGLICFVLGS